MSSISVMGLGVNSDVFEQVMKNYNQGKTNELVRFMLEQYNWTRLSRSFESTITYNQSKRLLVLYITMIKIANAITGKGEYNLTDTRTNEIIGHRGWYIRDYIFKDIVQKQMPKFNDVNQMYKQGQKFMSPEYGVVQSIITGQDLQKWLDAYKNQNFAHKDTDVDTYFTDAQQVFRNIASGRSVVLLTNDTLRALTDFMGVFADKTNPLYKPEYNTAIDETLKVVKGDIAEFNEFMKQQNSYDR